MKIKLTKNSGRITIIILFVFFSFLYIHTAAPSVYVGDSGELAAGIKNLEIVHPTGFPLYLITANLFAKFLPFDEFAFRLNAYSAFLTAAGLVFVFFSIKSLGISYLASLFTVLILGLGKTIWFHSGTTGVYPLSLFLSSVLLFIFSKWLNTKKLTLVFWCAFVLGVSFGTHVLMAAMFVPFGYMLWINRHEIMRSGGTMAKIAFLFCVPFIQYIYLFMARTRQETITTFKINGFRELLNYLGQKEYVYKIGARTLANTGDFIKKSASLFVSEFTLVFFILAIIGLAYLYKKSRNLAILTLGIVGVNIGIMYFYGNSNDMEILYRYYFIPYLVLTIPIAYTLEYIFNEAPKKNLRVIVFLALSAGLFVEFWFSYTQNNRRDNYLVSDFANNILLTAETSAIILSAGDAITGPLWYLQGVDVRPDVKIVDLNLLSDDTYILNWSNRDPNIMDRDFIGLKGGGQVKLRLLALLNKNIDQHKIYIISNPSDKDITKDFEFLPVGVVNQVFRKNSISIDEFKELHFNNWQRYTMRGITNIYKDSFLNQITQVYSIMLSNSGVIYFNAGLLDDAKLAFEKSIDINPKNTAAQDGLKIINPK